MTACGNGVPAAYAAAAAGRSLCKRVKSMRPVLMAPTMARPAHGLLVSHLHSMRPQSAAGRHRRREDLFMSVDPAVPPTPRVGVLVVAYNAATTLVHTLER